MQDDRITAARKRIDAALARIEQNASQAHTETETLRKSHNALRASVTTTLSNLDQLIEKLEE
ncbi:hypothetical protein [Qipengyuania sp. DGS5-3]|uniref:hypothetical protein n=1 Tax=Qipengyuania sp. DGS5-3 TaxID=3349632 RepID=UPI0036D43814